MKEEAAFFVGMFPEEAANFKREMAETDDD